MSYIFLTHNGRSSIKDSLEAYSLTHLVPLNKLNGFDFSAGFYSNKEPSKMTFEELLGYVGYQYFGSNKNVIKLPKELETDKNLIKQYKNNYVGSCSGKIKKADLLPYAIIYKNYESIADAYANWMLPRYERLNERLSKCGFSKKELDDLEKEQVKLVKPLIARVGSRLEEYKNTINKLPILFSYNY